MECAPLCIVDLAAILVLAFGPSRALVQSARDPAAYEIRYLERQRSRPSHRTMRRAGVGFLVGGPALLWAAHRADLWIVWLVLGSFYMLSGVLFLLASYTRTARAFEPDYGPAEPAGVYARRRRLTQLVQVAFLCVWLFAWRDLVTRL